MCWYRPEPVRRPRRSGSELPEQFEARLLTRTVNGERQVLISFPPTRCASRPASWMELRIKPGPSWAIGR